MANKRTKKKERKKGLHGFNDAGDSPYLQKKKRLAQKAWEKGLHGFNDPVTLTPKKTYKVKDKSGIERQRNIKKIKNQNLRQLLGSDQKKVKPGRTWKAPDPERVFNYQKGVSASMQKSVSQAIKKARPVDGPWKHSLLGDLEIGNKGMSGRGSLLHRVAPTADNLGLGIRLNKSAAVAGVAALAVGTALSAAIGQAQAKTQGIQARAEEVGTLPGMSYDAIGSGGKDLGATGDLVFGLNKMRRGR